jgi:ribosomal protein S18 acetylase RimI-like enzyme
MFFSPFQDAHLSALARLRGELQGLPDGTALQTDLSDHARGFGRQTVVALQGGQPVGCAGWVTLGVPHDGCAYGIPLFAAEGDVAQSLVARVIREVAAAGAKRLRIGCFAAEQGKRRALADAGFRHLFSFVRLEKSLPFAGKAVVPDWLTTVLPARIDWDALAELYCETFREVPNAPPETAEQMRGEWHDGDWLAGRVLADRSGIYQAFSLVRGCEMAAIGVRAALRGKGLADALYHIAGTSLVDRGHRTVTALVADCNQPSMALHLRLGFRESRPRSDVFEKTLLPEDAKPSAAERRRHIKP